MAPAPGRRRAALPAALLLALCTAAPAAAARQRCAPIPGCAALDRATCLCRRCHVMPGCGLHSAADCKCIAPLAGYDVLVTGVTGCTEGYGSFQQPPAAGAPAAALPTAPPACPPSELTADLSNAAAARLARRARVHGCECLPCPANLTTQGMTPIELAQCLPPGTPFEAASTGGGCGAAVLTAAFWYSPSRAAVTGVRVALADGSAHMLGVEADVRTDVAVPAGGRIAALAIRQGDNRVESVRLFSAYPSDPNSVSQLNLNSNGDELAFVGDPASKQPLRVWPLPPPPAAADGGANSPAAGCRGGCGALTRLAAAFAYPGGPIVSLRPYFGGAEVGGPCVRCGGDADCAAAGGGKCDPRSGTCV